MTDGGREGIRQLSGVTSNSARLETGKAAITGDSESLSLSII